MGRYESNHNRVHGSEIKRVMCLFQLFLLLLYILYTLVFYYIVYYEPALYVSFYRLLCIFSQELSIIIKNTLVSRISI